MVADLRKILAEAEALHLEKYKVKVYAVDHFDAWFKSHLKAMNENVSEWVVKYTGILLEKDYLKNDVTLKQQVNNMFVTGLGLEQINTECFFPSLDN